jgi:adenylate kinase
MRIVMLGAPGTGKGTQTARLADRLHIPHFSTGEMLRAAVAAGSDLGRQAAVLIDRGNLVPDDLAVAIVGDCIRHPHASSKFILDGFPRTIPQARALDDLLAVRNLALDWVIELRLHEDVLLDRIRRRARQAGARGERPRNDDNPQVLKVRLEAYGRHTALLVEFYEAKGILKSIDGLGTIDVVGERISAAIEALPAERHVRQERTT